MTERQVIIRGKTFLYKQKAPFVQSGVSVQGALEYDQQEDRIRCHECGAWFEALGTHLRVVHGMTALAYKLAHGLGRGTGLINERLRGELVLRGKRVLACVEGGVGARAAQAREALRRQGYPHPARTQRLEERNEKGTCQAQLLAKIKRIAGACGHTPSRNELADRGVSHQSALHALNVRDMASVMEMAGLLPNKFGYIPGRATGRPMLYSREGLLEMLRNFKAHSGRLPSFADCSLALPCAGTFYKHFGSWREALRAAGLGRVAA